MRITYRSINAEISAILLMAAALTVNGGRYVMTDSLPDGFCYNANSFFTTLSILHKELNISFPETL